MMPAIVVAPVAIVANAPGAVIGPDNVTTAVRVIIGVAIIGRAIEEVPAVMPERESAVVKAATVENMRGSKPAGMNGRAMERATAVVTTATVVTSSATTMTTMAAANLGG